MLSRAWESFKCWWFLYTVIGVFLSLLILIGWAAIFHPCIEHKDWVHEVTVCTRPGTHICMEYEKIMKHEDVCLRYR